MSWRPVGVVNFRMALDDWPLGGRGAWRAAVSAAAAPAAVNGGSGGGGSGARRVTPSQSVLFLSGCCVGCFSVPVCLPFGRGRRSPL